MNNRFVVPGAFDNVTTFASLHNALVVPGLNNGDIIQIEPGSTPGHIVNADIPAVSNLTIQGNPAFDVQSIPYFFLDDNVTIGSAQHGFTLYNVEFDAFQGNLQFTTNGTITGCRMKNDADVPLPAIFLTGGPGALITNSYFENLNPLFQYNVFLWVAPAAG